VVLYSLAKLCLQPAWFVIGLLAWEFLRGQFIIWPRILMLMCEYSTLIPFFLPSRNNLIKQHVLKILKLLNYSYYMIIWKKAKDTIKEKLYFITRHGINAISKCKYETLLHRSAQPVWIYQNKPFWILFVVICRIMIYYTESCVPRLRYFTCHIFTLYSRLEEITIDSQPYYTTFSVITSTYLLTQV
jgi:hypothetical protein